MSSELGTKHSHLQRFVILAAAGVVILAKYREVLLMVGVFAVIAYAAFTVPKMVLTFIAIGAGMAVLGLALAGALAGLGYIGLRYGTDLDESEVFER